MKSKINLLIITMIFGIAMILIASEANDPTIFILKAIAGVIVAALGVVIYYTLEKRGALGKEPEDHTF